MSRVLHLDCQAGISGDMTLAVFLDLGMPVEYLQKELDKLSCSGFSLKAHPAEKSGIWGTALHVEEVHNHKHALHHSHLHTSLSHHEHEHRSYKDIVQLIQNSTLSDSVKEHACSLFHTLALAEAAVHGKELQDIHFHEVGAIDSLVDMVGACIGLEYFHIDKVTATSVELGSGTVRCAHGIIPVPAPATALLSRDIPTSLGGTDHEATTPTGMAFIATFVRDFNPHLAGTCLHVGVGIGQRNSDKIPNILRALLYDIPDSADASTSTPGTSSSTVTTQQTEYVEITANIDDMTAEHLAFLCEKLREAGAVDVWMESLVMKKNRLGSKVSALVSPLLVTALREQFFTYSSTLGIREHRTYRHERPRQMESIDSIWGPVRRKLLSQEAEILPLSTKWEFDDLARISNETRLPLSTIINQLNNDHPLH